MYDTKTSDDPTRYAHAPAKSSKQQISCNAEQERAKVRNPDSLLRHMIV